MTTYTSHDTLCTVCNRLARITQQEAAITGRAQHRIVSRGNKLHVAATINNGKTNRTSGDEAHGKDYPQ